MSGSARIPRLVAGLLGDKFFASAIARVATSIATTAKGAANGVAGLDAQSLAKYSELAPGEGIWVQWDSVTGWPATRPTSRADICVRLTAPSSFADPSAWLTSLPSWVLTNDLFSIVDPGSTGPGAGAVPLPDAGVFPDSGALLRS